MVMVVTVVMGISLVDEEISAISSLGVCVVWCVGVRGSAWECVGVCGSAWEGEREGVDACELEGGLRRGHGICCEALQQLIDASQAASMHLETRQSAMEDVLRAEQGHTLINCC